MYKAKNIGKILLFGVLKFVLYFDFVLNFVYGPGA